MSFDYSAAPIVRLAWERGLGLPKAALVGGTDSGRITAERENGELTFLRLWNQAVLTGPASLLQAASAFTDDELSDHATMLRLSRDSGGRGGSTQTLYYADDLPLRQPASTITVSRGNPEVVALEALCPPDDVNDVGLRELPYKFTLMDVTAQDFHADHDGEDPVSEGGPIATSAYAEYQGLLAHLRTLVAPEHRGQGFGLLATNIAAHEALADGLVLQWQADLNNAAAHALAISTGFSVAGLLTSVALAHLPGH